MKMEIIKKLIDLGNKSKNNDNYIVANICFAMIADIVIKAKNPSFLAVEYEDAGDSGSSYYDLLNFTVDNNSLCIPLPLLKSNTVYKLIPLISSMTRREHNRKINNNCLTAYKLCEQFLQIIKPIIHFNSLEDALPYIKILLKKYLSENIEYDSILNQIVKDRIEVSCDLNIVGIGNIGKSVYKFPNIEKARIFYTFRSIEYIDIFDHKVKESIREPVEYSGFLPDRCYYDGMLHLDTTVQAGIKKFRSLLKSPFRKGDLNLKNSLKLLKELKDFLGMPISEAVTSI